MAFPLEFTPLLPCKQLGYCAPQDCLQVNYNHAHLRFPANDPYFFPSLPLLDPGIIRS